MMENDSTSLVVSPALRRTQIAAHREGAEPVSELANTAFDRTADSHSLAAAVNATVRRLEAREPGE